MKHNIGIIDADLLDNGTRHPNLALMKLSGYLKEQGEEVQLLDSFQDLENYYRVYISKVFSYTKIPISISNQRNIRTGGTGFYHEGGIQLPNKVEHHPPDYLLYDNYINNQVAKGVDRNKFSDYQKFSIGFTTRGCFRQCDFCVNKRFFKVVAHSPIKEFLDEKRFGIYLWDDNFLGFNGWEEILNQLINTGKPFQFRQGLDIRLMDEKKAKKLSQSKYYGDFIFAFDDIKDKEIIERKLTLWRNFSQKNTKLFLLCGYKSLDSVDIENAFIRIEVLMKFGCVPYIMRYEEYKNSKYKSLYIQLARWCNQPQFFKKKSFRQYCVANLQYNQAKYGNTATSSSYQAMIDFEREYPEIAKKYFDLRFEDLNQYLK